MSPQGNLYVARFDFSECSKNGIISVVNGESGQIEEELMVADSAEITGLYFSKVQDDILYATESSTNSILKIQIDRHWAADAIKENKEKNRESAIDTCENLNEKAKQFFQ